MLRLGFDRFTSGRSKFADHAPGRPDPTAKIYVNVRFGESTTLAQLDTGAAWSVMPPDVARALAVSTDTSNPTRMSTRLGVKNGYLVKVPFVLIADEGADLTVTGTFFICEDWPEGMTFLGYSGLLDAIRFALDPQANDFYFGASTESW